MCSIDPRLARLALASCLAWSSAMAQSDDVERPWAAGMAAQVDDESSSSFFTTFNWGVRETTWLSFAAGRVSSPSDRADVMADSLSAGVDHRFGLFGFTFELESWGDPDAVESSDKRVSLYLQGERFRLGWEHDRRDIDISFTTLGLFDRPVSRSLGLTGEGDGLSLRVEVAPRWRLYASSMSYDYSRNVALLPTAQALNLLSASALTLANSFVDEEKQFGIEWEAGDPVLNLSYARDRSAVDGLQFESFNAAVLFPVSRRVDIELNIGKSSSKLLDDGAYGGILVLIYGG